jgi:diguanylate cyclase (GGDEF)-like protein
MKIMEFLNFSSNKINDDKRRQNRSNISKYFVITYLIIVLISISIISSLTKTAFNNFMSYEKSEIRRITYQSYSLIYNYLNYTNLALCELSENINKSKTSLEILSSMEKTIRIVNEIKFILFIDKTGNMISTDPELNQELIKSSSVCHLNIVYPCYGDIFLKDGEEFSTTTKLLDKGRLIIGRLSSIEFLKRNLMVDFKNYEISFIDPGRNILSSTVTNPYIPETDLKKPYTENLFFGKNTISAIFPMYEREKTIIATSYIRNLINNFIKLTIPFILVIISGFILLTLIFIVFSIKISNFLSKQQIRLSFSESTREINSILIEKTYLYDITQKICNILTKIEEIEVCAFLFQERDNIKIKSIHAKNEDCINIFFSFFNFLTARDQEFRDFYKNIKNKEFLLVNEIKNNKIFYHIRQYGELSRIRSAIFLPIKINNNYICTLTLWSDKKIFDREIILILEEISKNISNKLEITNLEIEQERIKRSIKYLAYHDHLTNLYNRSFLKEYITKILSKSKKALKIAVFEMDLDKFKAVNDTFGHDVGDELLKIVAKRIKSLIRTQDILVRLGGDEFALVTESFNSEGDLELIASRIIEKTCEPFVINNLKINIGISIGIAYFSGEYKKDINVLENILFKTADNNVYASKANGRNRYTISKIDTDYSPF